MPKKKTTLPIEPIQEQVVDPIQEPVTELPIDPIQEPITEQASDYLVDVLDLTLGTYSEALTRLSALAGSEAADSVIDQYENAFDNRLQQRFAEFVPSVSLALRSRFGRIAETNRVRTEKRAARIAEMNAYLQLPEVAIIGSLPYWEPKEES